MKGFKEFLMRGNLIELAVAFVMGGAFAAVVTTFTKVIMDVLGKLGGQPNFDAVSVGGVNIGKFLTALVAFVIMAAVVYFFIVKPYEAAKNRLAKKEEAVVVVTQEELLTDIRDLLKTR